MMPVEEKYLTESKFRRNDPAAYGDITYTYKDKNIIPISKLDSNKIGYEYISSCSTCSYRVTSKYKNIMACKNLEVSSKLGQNDNVLLSTESGRVCKYWRK